MGQISDVEREMILEDFKDVLDEYDYTYTTKALNKIIDTWAEQKGDIIKYFKKSPNYVEGKFCIIFDANYKRNIDPKMIGKFFNWLHNECVRKNEFIENLPKEINEQRVREGNYFLTDNIYRLVYTQLEYFTSRELTEGQAILVNTVMPNIHAHTGQKTSRIVNKICKYLGYDKHPDYNREYAKYADALSPIEIKRKTILSVNPIDYLTMSFGKSWASCHTIDKANKRNMPNSYEGQYSSGTMSYMLDETSIVMYTIDADYKGDKPYFEPKINRNMFHWSFPNLVQGRMYPQDNDGCAGIYAEFRAVAQKVIAEIHDFPNLWLNKKGTMAAESHIYTEGTHYPDYHYYENCNLSIVKGKEDNEEMMTVGHDPICIECGNEHDTEDYINCCTKPNIQYCEECGCAIENEDEEYWVDGQCYCQDCVYYCDCCNEYYVGEGYRIIGNRWDSYVCQGCFDEYYGCCEECDYNYDVDNMCYIENTNTYVCQNCFDECNYSTCDSCGYNFSEGNTTYVESVEENVCERCLNKNFEKCNCCNNFFTLENVIEIANQFYCEDCESEVESEAV